MVQSHLLAYAAGIGKVGTCVMMILENEANKDLREVFDKYADVEQGFADEIFRVYALSHPEICIRITNASSEVIRMVHHVARGNMSENIAFAPDTLYNI